MRHLLPYSVRRSSGRQRSLVVLLTTIAIGALVAVLGAPAMAAPAPKLTASVTCSLAGRDTPGSSDDRYKFLVTNVGSTTVTADIGSRKDHGDTPPVVRSIAPRKSVSYIGNESALIVTVDGSDAGTYAGDDPSEVVVQLDPPPAGQVADCGGTTTPSRQDLDRDRIKDCVSTIETLTGLKGAAAARLTTEQLRRAVRNEAARNPVAFTKKLLDLSGNIDSVNKCTQFTGGTYADLVCNLNIPSVTKFFTFGRYTRC